MRGPLRLSWGDASPTPGQGFLQALGRWGRWEPLQGGWVVQGNASVSGGLGWQGLPSTTGTSISYLLGMAQLDIGPVCVASRSCPVLSPFVPPGSICFTLTFVHSASITPWARELCGGQKGRETDPITWTRPAVGPQCGSPRLQCSGDVLCRSPDLESPRRPGPAWLPTS